MSTIVKPLKQKNDETSQTKGTPPAKRLEELLTIIEAMEGKPCPTNEQLSYVMRYTHITSVSTLLAYLYKTGQLVNVGSRQHRQLLVTRSGKTTAPSDVNRL